MLAYCPWRHHLGTDLSLWTPLLSSSQRRRFSLIRIMSCLWEDQRFVLFSPQTDEPFFFPPLAVYNVGELQSKTTCKIKSLFILSLQCQRQNKNHNINKNTSVTGEGRGGATHWYKNKHLKQRKKKKTVTFKWSQQQTHNTCLQHNTKQHLTFFAAQNSQQGTFRHTQAIFIK